MVFEILTFDFHLKEKGNTKLLFRMQAHHNGKMKELFYPSPILRVASKFVYNITTKPFIG